MLSRSVPYLIPVVLLAVCWPVRAGAKQLAGVRTANTPASTDAVDALRQRWMTGSATAVVHVSNLHATTRPMMRPVDNLVAGGVVQPRPFAGMLRGADQLIQAGQTVKVVGLEAVEGRKNDLLRFTVVTPGNAVAPIAFVVAAGALRTLTEAQLQALVLPILTPVSPPSNTAPDGQHAATGFAPTQSTPVAPTWLVRQTPAGAEALLRGTAEGAHQTAPAVLVLGCPTEATAAGRPASTPYLELRVPKPVFPFDITDVGEKDGDDNGDGHIQIGTSPEIQVDLAPWTVIPDTGNVAPLDLDVTLAELEAVLSQSNAPLRIGVLPAGQSGAGLTARFTLPADPARARSALASCFQTATAAQAALHASRAVECPAIPDLVLIEGDVRRASTGKSLPTDPEHDQGAGWVLPKPTRSHPIAPKVQLVCSYGHPNPHPEARVREKVISLPIPASASYCEFFSRTVQDRSSAYCQR